MNLTAGFPGALIRFPRRRARRCSTPIRLPTPRALAASIPMAPGLTAVDMGTAGDHLELATVGHPSRMGNGFWIPPSAGPGSASNRGAGLPIITVAGSLTPVAADGFILHPCSLAFPRVFPEDGFRRWFILRAPSFIL